MGAADADVRCVSFFSPCIHELPWREEVRKWAGLNYSHIRIVWTTPCELRWAGCVTVNEHPSSQEVRVPETGNYADEF